MYSLRSRGHLARWNMKIFDMLRIIPHKPRRIVKLLAAVSIPLTSSILLFTALTWFVGDAQIDIHPEGGQPHDYLRMREVVTDRMKGSSLEPRISQVHAKGDDSVISYQPGVLKDPLKLKLKPKAKENAKTKSVDKAPTRTPVPDATQKPKEKPKVTEKAPRTQKGKGKKPKAEYVMVNGSWPAKYYTRQANDRGEKSPDNCSGISAPDQEAMSRSPYRIPMLVKEDKFTLQILSHYDRPSILKRALTEYGRMKIIDMIVVTWSNQQIAPPANLTALKLRMPLKIERMPANLIRLRFNYTSGLRTQGVLTIDDDQIIDERDLKRAFGVWKLHPYGIASFFARWHAVDPNGRYRYVYHPRPKRYSMALTGAAFVHREYLRMYMEKLPKEVAAHIDREQNCEDIAMNFLISAHCRCAGAFYTIPRQIVRHLSRKNGISTKKGHGKRRDDCVDTFVKYYNNKLPLQTKNCWY